MIKIVLIKIEVLNLIDVLGILIDWVISYIGCEIRHGALRSDTRSISFYIKLDIKYSTKTSTKTSTKFGNELDIERQTQNEDCFID